jgi:hypothetical protein
MMTAETMSRCRRRVGIAASSIAALLLTGCAMTSPPAVHQESSPAPASASPPAANTTNFASPKNLFQLYPEMRRQDL